MGSRIRTFFVSPAALYCMASFLLAGVLAGGLIGYSTLRKTVIQNMFSHYNAALSILNENLNSYLHTQMNLVQELAQSAEVIQASQYPSKRAQLASFFQKKLPSTCHQLLFSTEHQVLFTSTGNASLYETNAALKTSAQRSLILVSPDVSDFVIIPDHRPTLYITVPVLGKNGITAILAVSIDYEHLAQLAADYSQLGNTGEFIIAKLMNDAVTTVFPPRFHPAIVFKEYPDKTAQKILHAALMGEAGSRILGSSVYIWQYMPLVQWGVVCKSDYAHGVQPLRNIRIFILVLGLLCLLGIIFCWYRAWADLRNFYSAATIVSVLLQLLLYGLFITTIWLSIFVGRTHYNAYHQRAHKETLAFKGAVQKAALMINYQASLVEDAASSFVADALGTSSLEESAVRLQRVLHDNPDVQGAVYVFPQGKSWDVMAYTAQASHGVKQLALSSEQKKFWKDKMLERHVTWMLELAIGAVGLPQQTQEPFYVIPFYSSKDTERRTPIGCLALMYSTQRMVTIARQIMGSVPIALLQQDGLAVFKDKTFPQTTTSYTELRDQPVRLNGFSLYTEKMINLGWYLQAIFVPASQVVSVAIATLMLLMLLGCMCVCVYSLYCSLGLTHKRKMSNLFLVVVCAVVAGCLILVSLTLM